MFRRLIVLAILATGFWWYWARWRPARDFSRLETAVNHELLASGLGDKDVLQMVHREHGFPGLRWTETDRHIQLKPEAIPVLMDKISRQADKLGYRVLARDASVLKIGIWPVVTLQRVEFTAPEAAAALTPQAAIVIDDVAYDLAPMDHFAALGIPLTFAILPRDKNTQALAEKAVQMNFPVILHLPMQPIDLAHNNPGGAGLYLNMTPEQLHQQFEKDVASVPHIQGINNHMGSAFTEDAGKMTLVLKWVKEKKLFFLDSRTSVHSVVPRVAKTVGVPCLVNETFLDNEDDVAAIEKQLDIVMKLALKHKQTIAIGHYRRKHLVEAIANKLPDFKAHGVTLTTLPTFYERLRH